MKLSFSIFAGENRVSSDKLTYCLIWDVQIIRIKNSKVIGGMVMKEKNMLDSMDLETITGGSTNNIFKDIWNNIFGGGSSGGGGASGGW